MEIRQTFISLCSSSHLFDLSIHILQWITFNLTLCKSRQSLDVCRLLRAVLFIGILRHVKGWRDWDGIEKFQKCFVNRFMVRFDWSQHSVQQRLTFFPHRPDPSHFTPQKNKFHSIINTRRVFFIHLRVITKPNLSSWIKHARPCPALHISKAPRTKALLTSLRLSMNRVRGGNIAIYAKFLHKSFELNIRFLGAPDSRLFSLFSFTKRMFWGDCFCGAHRVEVDETNGSEGGKRKTILQNCFKASHRTTQIEQSVSWCGFRRNLHEQRLFTRMTASRWSWKDKGSDFCRGREWSDTKSWRQRFSSIFLLLCLHEKREEEEKEKVISADSSVKSNVRDSVKDEGDFGEGRSSLSASTPIILIDCIHFTPSRSRSLPLGLHRANPLFPVQQIILRRDFACSFSNWWHQRSINFNLRAMRKRRWLHAKYAIQAAMTETVFSYYELA